jgi:hypothetical protein
MDTKSWNQLKVELQQRGFSVQTKGRSRREYIAQKDNTMVDIFRGGLTGTGTKLLMYIYNDEAGNIEFEKEDSFSKNLLDALDAYLEELTFA